MWLKKSVSHGESPNLTVAETGQLGYAPANATLPPTVAERGFYVCNFRARPQYFYTYLGSRFFELSQTLIWEWLACPVIGAAGKFQIFAWTTDVSRGVPTGNPSDCMDTRLRLEKYNGTVPYEFLYPESGGSRTQIR